MSRDNALDGVDPDVAVDRALRESDRLALLAGPLAGIHGVTVAVWIREARNTPGYAPGLAGSWWNYHGHRSAAAVAGASGLPTHLVKRILTSALYALIGAGTVAQGYSRADRVVEVAERAALWARGWAECAGWQPDTPRAPAPIPAEGNPTP